MIDAGEAIVSLQGDTSEYEGPKARLYDFLVLLWFYYVVWYDGDNLRRLL